VVVLALYPESLRQTVAGALFTVVVGVVLLFAPMRFLLVALVPRPGAAPEGDESTSTRPIRRASQWAVVAAIGVVAGIAVVAAEMLKDSGGIAPPLPRLLFVAAVYVGLETAGLLTGYALLRGPVGITLTLPRFRGGQARGDRRTEIGVDGDPATRA
jgi:hypothetical protein